MDSSCWEAASRSATQKFPTILCSPKFHCRVQKIPSLVPILNQINPVHIITSYFSNIYFNIILPFSLGFPNALFPSGFLTKTVQKDIRLLRHYATSLKLAGSIPDEVTGFLNWPNPSSRTMNLGSTHPLTEISTTNLPGGKGQSARKDDRLTAICEPIA
jgi:hypothetical protein